MAIKEGILMNSDNNTVTVKLVTSPEVEISMEKRLEDIHNRMVSNLVAAKIHSSKTLILAIPKMYDT